MKCSEDPMALCGQPIGMYHCPECGCMQVACNPHCCDPEACLLEDCDDCTATLRNEYEQRRAARMGLDSDKQG